MIWKVSKDRKTPTQQQQLSPAFFSGKKFEHDHWTLSSKHHFYGVTHTAKKVSVWPQYSFDRPTPHALCVDILNETVVYARDIVYITNNLNNSLLELIYTQQK